MIQEHLCIIGEGPVEPHHPNSSAGWPFVLPMTYEGRSYSYSRPDHGESLRIRPPRCLPRPRMSIPTQLDILWNKMGVPQELERRNERYRTRNELSWCCNRRRPTFFVSKLLFLRQQLALWWGLLADLKLLFDFRSSCSLFICFPLSKVFRGGKLDFIQV